MVESCVCGIENAAAVEEYVELEIWLQMLERVQSG